MTIKKGQQWGWPLKAPRPDAVASTDAELATLAANGARRVQVTGGDLLATLGLQPGDDRVTRGEAWEFPIDLGWASLDGSEEQPFVAHLWAGRRWWHGHAVVLCNAAWWGPFYLGPKAHPNDGLLDVTEGRLSWRDRRRARVLALTGSHLPHPDLMVARTAVASFAFEAPAAVTLDNIAVGQAQLVEARTEPDALFVVA